MLPKRSPATRMQLSQWDTCPVSSAELKFGPLVFPAGRRFHWTAVCLHPNVGWKSHGRRQTGALNRRKAVPQELRWRKSGAARTLRSRTLRRKESRLRSLTAPHLKPCWRIPPRPWRVWLWLSDSRYPINLLVMHVVFLVLHKRFFDLLQDLRRSYQPPGSCRPPTCTTWWKATLKYPWSVQKYSNCWKEKNTRRLR